MDGLDHEVGLVDLNVVATALRHDQTARARQPRHLEMLLPMLGLEGLPIPFASDDDRTRVPFAVILHGSCAPASTSTRSLASAGYVD